MANRARARREKLKEETAMLNAKRQLISDAEAVPDLLADLPMFRQFSRNGLTCSVSCHLICPDEYRDWVFAITMRHMQRYYETSWGWSEKNKRQELFEEHSRYLIAVTDDHPIGFIHIRFEFESQSVMLYVYELQIEDEYQRKGLGRFLMQAAEFIALKRKMERVMLTVFKANTASRDFYRKMNYQMHPTSPDLCDREAALEATYEILFKPLVKK
jgi:ribosomal protein S18 acetylase RimI-like enzyme